MKFCLAVTSCIGDRSILKPIGLAVRSSHCLLPHQILTDFERLAATTAADNGYQLCGVEVLTHRKPMTMQVQIRHAGGEDVSLDDCASFSTPMEEAIESSQLLTEAYVLEISSPGINETLLTDRDFQTFRGFPVEVIFNNEQHSKMSRKGLLHERSKDYVLLNIKGRMSRIPREEVTDVRLISPSG